MSIEEVVALARADDASSDEHLAEMWLHGLSGESVELFNLDKPLVTEPDMRNVLLCVNRPWTVKYLARWSDVRGELRALLDDPHVRQAAMPPQERANLHGWDISRPVAPVPSVPLRLAGLDRVAEAEKQRQRTNRRILAAFPSLKNDLRG